MSSVKWIKLFVDLFGNRKIKQIRTLPDGNALVVIWLQLLCLAGQTNDGGSIYFSKGIPYTDEMLSTEFGFPVSTIRLALNTFESFCMLENVGNVLLISNWEKYQSVDKLEQIRASTRNRVAEYRERQKLISEHTPNVTLPVTPCNALDIEEDIEEDREVDKEEKPKVSKAKKASAKQWEKELGECGFSPELHDEVDKWLRYKHERNQPYKPTGLSTLLKRIGNQVGKYGEITVIDLIDESISQNWMGIAWDKLNNKTKSMPKPIRQSSSDKMLELIKEGAFDESV